MRRQGAIEAKVDTGLNILHPVAEPNKGLPETPCTLSAMTDEAGFRHEVASMFGANEASRVLADRLLQIFPVINPETAASEAAAYRSPLMVATALLTVSNGDVSQSNSLLDAINHHEDSSQKFSLMRILAASGAGANVVGTLMHVEDAAQQERLIDKLSICSEIEKKGVALAEHTSVESLAQAISARGDIRLDQDIGSDVDQPLQLLAKALLHAHSEDSSAVNMPMLHKAAFVAWKKGGFTESGRGTDFNKAIERLHKFQTYVDRAGHGERTLGNLGKEVRTMFLNTVGRSKSPLSSMRNGTMGGDLGLLHEEATKFKERLDFVIDAMTECLADEIRTPEVQGDPAHLNSRLARLATLALWKSGGSSTGIKVSDVMEQARAFQERAGGDPGQVTEQMIHSGLRNFTNQVKPLRTKFLCRESTVKINLSALEEMAAILSRRHPARYADIQVASEPTIIRDPLKLREEIQALRRKVNPSQLDRIRLKQLQSQRLSQMNALIAELRAIKHGGEPRIPLFKISDIKGLLGGETRMGPTPVDAQKVMHNLASAKYESMSNYSSGGTQGVNAFGAFVLKASLAVGVPVVYPVLSAERGQKATVTVGVSNTGGRLFVGKEWPKPVKAGVGAAWGWSAPPIPISGAVIGELAVGGQISNGEGVCITARNDMPGWDEKLPQVVDFLFEQARTEQANGQRPQTPTEFWIRFVDKFGDDPAIGVGWNSEASVGVAPQVAAAAALRVNIPPKRLGLSLGPAFTVGAKHERNRFTRTPHAVGADVPVVVDTSKTSLNTSLSVAAPIKGRDFKSGTAKELSIGMPLVGVTAEWNISGGLGVARLGRTKDGLLSPGLCHKEFIFREPKRLIEYANLHRAGWEAALVEQDPTKLTTPEIARERLNNFLEQVAAVPARADRLHGELKTLDPQVADQINNYEARFHVLLGKGDAKTSGRELTPSVRAECNRLENEIHRLLKAETSWKHGGLYAVEINQKSSSIGISFGIKAAGTQDAAATRLTALLVASEPRAA